MKAGKHFIMAMLCIIVSNAYAQRTLVTYNASFDWANGSDKLSQSQKKAADSIYNSLIAGESIKLNMLNEEEEKLPDLERGLLSFRRATALVDYCVENKFSQNEFYAEMVPFQMPHTLKSNDLMFESHKAFMSKKSQSYFVFVKPKLMVTTKPAAYFDASVSNDVKEFTGYWQNDIDVYPGGCTHIHIPANSLQRTNGQKPLSENVTVRVAQYLDMDAMAVKAMTTSSYGKKLQTAGMWYIEIMCNKEKLEMKPGTKYSIRVCFEGDVKPMRVFTGHKNGTMLDWKEETDDEVILPGTFASGQDLSDADQFLPNLNPDSAPSKKKKLFGGRNSEKSENTTWNDESPEGYWGETNAAILDPEMGQYYNLQLNDFGWINCDAFDEEDKLTDLMVNGDITRDMNVMLVFAKRKSVLPGYFCSDGKSIQFSNVASEETAMLVAFKPIDKNGNVIKFTKLITPGNQKSIRVHTEKSTLTDLQAEIKGTLADVY